LNEPTPAQSVHYRCLRLWANLDCAQEVLHSLGSFLADLIKPLGLFLSFGVLGPLIQDQQIQVCGVIVRVEGERFLQLLLRLLIVLLLQMDESHLRPGVGIIRVNLSPTSTLFGVWSCIFYNLRFFSSLSVCRPPRLDGFDDLYRDAEGGIDFPVQGFGYCGLTDFQHPLAVGFVQHDRDDLVRAEVFAQS